MLDVVDQPHWLKSFVLHFSVLVASKLDDQAEPSVSRGLIAQQNKGPSMAAPEQPSAGSTLSRAESVQKQTDLMIAPTSTARLDKAADQGWLSAKLLLAKPDSSGKQKQPKKRSKQKSESEMQSTQKADGDQPAKKGMHKLPGSSPAHADDSNWELQRAQCMDEAVNGKAFSDDSAEDHTCRMEGSFPEPAGQDHSHSLPNGHAGDAQHEKSREVVSAVGEHLWSEDIPLFLWKCQVSLCTFSSTSKSCDGVFILECTLI